MLVSWAVETNGGNPIQYLRAINISNSITFLRTNGNTDKHSEINSFDSFQD